MRYFKLFFLVLILTSCIATGKQTLQVQNKIVAPKIIAININSGPWMGEIERRLQRSGFQVIRNSMMGEKTLIKPDSKFKFNQSTTKYYLSVNAAAPTDYMRRCFGGGYNFDYIYADLVDTATGQTIASIEGRGYSEGCPPLAGSIYTNITKMVNDSWHPKSKSFVSTNSDSGELTQEKAITEYLSGRVLDSFEGIWGVDRAVILIAKNNSGEFDVVTLVSSTGFTKNGEKTATLKKISKGIYSGEAPFYHKEVGGKTTKTSCTVKIEMISDDEFERICDFKEANKEPYKEPNYIRLWPENFALHNQNIKN